MITFLFPDLRGSVVKIYLYQNVPKLLEKQSTFIFVHIHGQRIKLTLIWIQAHFFKSMTTVEWKGVSEWLSKFCDISSLHSGKGEHSSLEAKIPTHFLHGSSSILSDRWRGRVTANDCLYVKSLGAATSSRKTLSRMMFSRKTYIIMSFNRTT